MGETTTGKSFCQAWNLYSPSPNSPYLPATIFSASACFPFLSLLWQNMFTDIKYLGHNHTYRTTNLILNVKIRYCQQSNLSKYVPCMFVFPSQNYFLPHNPKRNEVRLGVFWKIPWILGSVETLTLKINKQKCPFNAWHVSKKIQIPTLSTPYLYPEGVDPNVK